MSARRRDGAARWLWEDPSAGARLTRAALLPLGMLYRLGVMARNAAYDAGAVPVRHLALPSIGVGNLAVGGTGKTPVTAFIARKLAERGVVPGIVMRGYGADEPAEHAKLVPGAIVIADPDRARGSEAARARGAQVLVLDDCLQRRDVSVDVMLALVAAESWDADRWPLPAGPWREGADALWRADAVVVTRKSAAPARAARIAAELAARTGGRAMVADLGIAGFEPLGGGPRLAAEVVNGREVLAVSGIGAPDAFRAQLQALGAKAEALAFADHHPYDAADVAGIVARAAGRTVVTTGKDAVKLAGLWPPGAACLVASVAVTVPVGGAVLEEMLDRVARAARTFTQPEAAGAPLQDL